MALTFDSPRMRFCGLEYVAYVQRRSRGWGLPTRSPPRMMGRKTREGSLERAKPLVIPRRCRLPWDGLPLAHRLRPNLETSSMKRTLVSLGLVLSIVGGGCGPAV